MPSKLSNLLMDDSFIRFLKGKASKEEEVRWTAWKQQSDEHIKLIAKGRELMSRGMQPLPKPDINLEYERLINRIDSENRYSSHNVVQKSQRKVVWATMVAAASILLIVGFFTRHAFMQNDRTEQSWVASIDYRTLESEFGQKTSIKYSDGSRIVLNANSSMRLPQKAVGTDTMQVWLDGEALFDIVRKPESRPRTFIVHTQDGSVSVLGTKFAVNTTKSQSQVVLEEGSVRIDVSKNAKDINLNYTMVPGDLALFSHGSDEIKVRQVNAEVYTSWAGDTLILDNTPLFELIDRIEFTHDVKVHVELEEILNEKLTGKFENSSLEFLLKGIAKALDVKITRQDKTIFIKENDGE
ncbi:MAG: FecR domain-containing protein [Gracilimonas sp.]|uniref:FecR family protein n=1 Tax=Gracilimonas sp. TaxID=1974203 RepID=UPI00374FFC1D|nr:FecR domain-containing protein [Gracilimonas sp.]